MKVAASSAALAHDSQVIQRANWRGLWLIYCLRLGKAVPIPLRRPASWSILAMLPAKPRIAMTYDVNNVFARILRGEIGSVKVYEDARTLAFMDVMPQAEGHTLVIPKEPAESIFDLSAEGAAALMATTQKVAGAVKKAVGAPGIMLAQLNGAAAGQTVFHVHFHIIPRSAGVDLGLHARGMVDPKSLEPIAAKIRSAL